MEKRQFSLPDRRLYGVQEAARDLNLSVWTLRAWAYKGKIASHKVSTRLMFDPAEIQRVIAESERPRLSNARKPATADSVYEARGPIVLGGA